MRNTIIVALVSVAFAAAGCVKKQADGSYRVDKPAASSSDAQRIRDNAAKSGDELKTDLQKAAEKLKEDAHKIRDSENAKRAEEKAGEVMEKAGEKLKKAGQKTQEKARQ